MGKCQWATSCPTQLWGATVTRSRKSWGPAVGVGLEQGNGRWVQLPESTLSWAAALCQECYSDFGLPQGFKDKSCPGQEIRETRTRLQSWSRFSNQHSIKKFCCRSELAGISSGMARRDSLMLGGSGIQQHQGVRWGKPKDRRNTTHNCL